MRELNRWGKDKHLGLVVAAQQLAMGIEPLSKWLRSIKVEELLGDHITFPPLKQWIYLYKDHRRLEKFLVEIFKEFGGIAEYGAYLAESFFEGIQYLRKVGPGSLKKQFEGMSDDEREGIQNEAVKILDQLYDLHKSDIESDIEGKVDKELLEKLKKAFKKPEMLFFLRVWVPCLFLYGEYPGKLLRKARLGIIDAMEKLLRVDPSAIGDKIICEQFHRASGKENKSDFNILVKALQKRPKGKVTQRKTKYSIAGLISALSNGSLTEPSIRRLFDAVAHDVKKEDIDTNLPDAAEAFSKAIQRQRIFWMSTIRPDKK